MSRRIDGATHSDRANEYNLTSVSCLLLQVRAAHSLLSITHSMKLLLLLSDESQITAQRDQEIKEIKTEVGVCKEQVAELLDELFRSQPAESSGTGRDQDAK